MLIVRISYKEKTNSKEIHQFSAKVKCPLEAIQSFYEQHPNAIWIGVRSIPVYEEAV